MLGMTRMLAPALTLVLLTLFAGAALAQTGALEAGDAQLDSGEYFDVHSYEGAAGERVEIALASDEFDVYLVVLGPDEALLGQFDDSPGEGTNVRTTLELPQQGSYTLGVTSALPGETGRYALQVTSLAAPGAADDGGFAGTFEGGGLTVTLEPTAQGYSGTFATGGQTFAASGESAGNRLSGTFESSGQAYAFSALLEGDTLTLESGGARYLLQRQGAAPQTGNPLAPPQAAAPQTPQTPVPQSEARPGYVTGTVFDAQGRPLAGAGVLISGTTFAQGQRTDFETTTGADGTYAVRVPDGRYQAKAWVNVEYGGAFFSRLLHPLSGNPYSEIDSSEGGTLDFQWRLSGLSAYSTPPGEDDTDFYGASIDFSYCGLPADAYCDAKYEAFPDAPIPGGSVVEVRLTPVGPLIDGSAGETIVRQFRVAEQDAEYPYGGAPNQPADYPGGGGGRTVLGEGWAYHGIDLNDIPLGSYALSATATLPDGRQQSLRLGLSPDDVEHASVTVAFEPWDDYQARSYIGGGIKQLRVYVRD